MKIKLTVPVTFEVELDSDGEELNHEYMSAAIFTAVDDTFADDIIAEELVEAISDSTGFCVNGMTYYTEKTA